jgi:hypothetical protein
MKDPIKVMLLGISIMLLGLFIQNTSSWDAGPTNAVQLLIAAGFITVLVGFFMNKGK